MQAPKITIFAGHYGSGKTNIAVNYAIWLKQTCKKVVICDLDIVNPYFKTSDSEELLKTHGITLISSKYSNSNVDLPAIPSETQIIFDDNNIHAVIDLGGDDRGALALGRYSKNIINSNYEMMLIVNKYRPLTQCYENLIEIKDEIENVSKVLFTGIINNSNLGSETTNEDVLNTSSFVEHLSKNINLPIKMTTINRELINISKISEYQNIKNIFPIDIYKKTTWKI